MKTRWKTTGGALLMAALMALSFAPDFSEAKRLGGGKSVGVQRSAPPQQGPAAQPNGPPATPAANPGTPAAGAMAGAAAAPRRSWMGPLVGLAAGLGIAAMLSHFGLGEGFASLLTALLLAAAAFFVIRFLLRRFGRQSAPATGLQFAGATSGGSGPAGWGASGSGRDAMQRSAAPVAPTRPTGSPLSLAKTSADSRTPAAAAPPAGIPADFDSAGFERIAKMIFIRLQAANDSADLDDLRRFTTPEVFAALRLDLQERGPSTQQTDVVDVQTQVIEVATDEVGRQVVSVRFHGLIREELNGSANRFDEVWHLLRPSAEGDGAWLIAGIQQRP